MRYTEGVEYFLAVKDSGAALAKARKRDSMIHTLGSKPSPGVVNSGAQLLEALEWVCTYHIGGVK